MASQRLAGPIITSVTPATLFHGAEEFERMKSLRSKITDVRRSWQSNDEYDQLKLKIRAYIEHESHSPELKSNINTLMSGYTDWADMDYHRPEQKRQTFTAIELYCSKEGYDLLFKIFNAVLRERETDDDVLLVAAALVELVTIELYNLRLSNIGDKRYENFEGITYRGMSITKDMAAVYKKAASNSDLSKRNFSVPLGFTSSSTARSTTADFINQNPDNDSMHWIIHIHGLDQRLLSMYEAKYPDSVVTSITAMPVGRIAELREKEILLRGAFFHIVQMTSEEVDGRTVHTLQLVVMNPNRDHGTELALDEGAKQEQRNFFRDMILASRFEICSSLAKQYCEVDSTGYQKLARTALERINAAEHLTHGFSPEVLVYEPDTVATWFGDKTGQSYSINYVRLRDQFHTAAQAGGWNAVRDIILGGYDWEIADWFNVQAFHKPAEAQGSPWRGWTLLHEMASLGSPLADDKNAAGWQYLLEAVLERDVFKSLRTADTNETAADIAYKRGDHRLAKLLFQPQSIDGQSCWDTNLHKIICDMVQDESYDEVFVMPQLAILSDIKSHRLWIPLPNTYGGLILSLEWDKGILRLVGEEVKTVKGQTKPTRSRWMFTRRYN